jgi:molecular chaperone GrpE
VPHDEPGTNLESPRSAPEDESEKVRSERDELVDRLARTQADFENARKRLVREQEQLRDFAIADTVKSLLPALDSFDRALDSPTQDVKEFRAGVELIRRQLNDVLGKLGLEPVNATGALFDPREHEAIESVARNDVPENHVAEELQRGYRWRDRLLRPARVVVARSPES